MSARSAILEKSVEMVSVSVIADHRHWYKLTGDTQYIFVSSLVRHMSLSHS